MADVEHSVDSTAQRFSEFETMRGLDVSDIVAVDDLRWNLHFQYVATVVGSLTVVILTPHDPRRTGRTVRPWLLSSRCSPFRIERRGSAASGRFRAMR